MGRRIITFLCTMAFAVTVIGLPRLEGPVVKADEDFPCRDHLCGCVNAEMCRTHCCCEKKTAAIAPAKKGCCGTKPATQSAAAKPDIHIGLGHAITAQECRGLVLGWLSLGAVIGPPAPLTISMPALAGFLQCSPSRELTSRALLPDSPPPRLA